jgi:hypothetical protein
MHHRSSKQKENYSEQYHYLAVWTLDVDTEHVCSFSCSHSTTSEEGLEPAVDGRRRRMAASCNASAMVGPSQAASLIGIHGSPPSLADDAHYNSPEVNTCKVVLFQHIC